MSDFMPFCKALPEVLVEGYAGIGGMAEGAKRLGIPTALAMDSWEPALAVHAINHPDTHHHDKVRFGHGSKGSIEEVAHRIEEAVDGQTYHLHGSPPCPLFTSANPLSDPKAGMEQEGGAGWWFKLIDRLKQGRNPPLSDSTENAPEMRPAILRDPSLPAYLHEAAAMPLLSGAEFGAPQTRARTVLGEGWEAQPTHSKDNFLSIEDVLPHLRGEWEDNLPSIREKVAGLAENNQIGLRGSKMFSEPTLSFGGAINPGSGGAKWNRFNDLEGTPGFSFGHTTPITNPAHGITHHRPTLTHTRALTIPEVLQLHGFRDDYDLSPGKGSHRLNTPARTIRPNIDTMLGNVLLPGVAEGVLRGHFGKSAVVKAPVVYHGGSEWESGPEHPIFFTDSKRDAEGFAWERGEPPTLQTADLIPFENPASVDDVIEASRGLVDSYIDDWGGGFQVEIWDEIGEHSPYDGTNPYDLMYIPRVREALKDKGFDGVSGMDVLSNYEIPIYVPLDHSQYTLREPTKVLESPYRDGEDEVV